MLAGYESTGAAGQQHGQVSLPREGRIRIAQQEVVHVMCPLLLCGRASGVAVDSRGTRFFFGHITLQRPGPVQQRGVGLPQGSREIFSFADPG
jgi:hypothetical protein